jgi:hypothetical protein
MSDVSRILSFVLPTLEIAGLLLIAFEVKLGHTMEEIAAGFHPVKKLQFLYATGDAYGYAMQNMLDKGIEPLTAREIANEMKRKSLLEENMQNDWNDRFLKATKSIKRYEQKTADLAMGRRRRNLCSGTLLLVFAAVGHLAEAMQAALE